MSGGPVVSITSFAPAFPNVANTITVSGSNWTPGETVTFIVGFSACTGPPQAVVVPSAVADGSGMISSVSNTFVPAWRNLGPSTIIFSLQATGSVSGPLAPIGIPLPLTDPTNPSITTTDYTIACDTPTQIAFTAMSDAGLSQLSLTLPPFLTPLVPLSIALCPNALIQSYGNMVAIPATGVFTLTANAQANSLLTTSRDFTVTVTGTPSFEVVFDPVVAQCPLSSVPFTLTGSCFSIGQHQVTFSWTDCRGQRSTQLTTSSTDGSLNFSSQVQVAWQNPLTFQVQVDDSAPQTLTTSMTDTVAPTASLSYDNCRLCIEAQDTGSGIGQIQVTGPGLNFTQNLPCQTCSFSRCIPYQPTTRAPLTLTVTDRNGNTFTDQIILRKPKFPNRVVFTECFSARVSFPQKAEYDPPSNSCFPLGKTKVKVLCQGVAVGTFNVVVKQFPC